MNNLYIGERISPKHPDLEYTTNITDASNFKIDACFLTNLTISTRNIKLIADKETNFSISIRNLFDYVCVDPGYENVGIDIPHYGRIFMIKITQNF